MVVKYVRVFTHVTELLIDFAGMYVDLHVRQADPLVQVFTVINFTDHFLGVAGSHHIQHVRRHMDFGFGLFPVLPVQTLLKRMESKQSEMDHSFDLVNHRNFFVSKYPVSS